MKIERVIKFNVDPKKAVETIIYLACKDNSPNQTNMMGMMFYADKIHLNKYGRPVLGDMYIKEKYGPIPSLVYGILKESCFFIGKKVIEYANNSFFITMLRNRTKLITPKREVNLDKFSESDLECLDEAYYLLNDKSSRDILHRLEKEKAWKETDIKSDIDYILMLDDNNPLKDGIVEDLEEISQAIVF
jgi:hypothetical protein